MQRVIDPHIHLWDHRRTPRRTSVLVKAVGWNRAVLHRVAGWLFPSDLYSFFGKPDHILADYLGCDYGRDTGGREVAGFVHVQAGWEGRGPLGPVGETRWLESLDLPNLAGIVAFADLSLGPEVDPVLRAHLDASPRFRGVRFMLAHHPDPGVHSFCERANQSWHGRWRRGYERLAAHGLSFDAWCYHHQLDDLSALARDFPEVPVILCHLATPVGYGGAFAGTGHEAGERSEVARRWRDGIARLAEAPNVRVKLSGLLMPVLGWGHHRGPEPEEERLADQLAPLIDFAIDAFGADRCMFASNFPVDKAGAPWATLFGAYERIVARRGEDERRALFFGTANRAYRLGL